MNEGLFQMCFLFFRLKTTPALFLKLFFVSPGFQHCQKLLANSGLGHMASNPAPTMNELCDFGQTTLSQSPHVSNGKIVLTSVLEKIK